MKLSLILVFALISLNYQIQATTSIESHVCSVSPSVLPTCEYSDIIPNFFVNIWVDDGYDFFTTCQHLVTTENIQVSLTPVCVDVVTTDYIDFSTLTNYTGDSSFCLTNSCVNQNPQAYCSYYTRDPIFNCNNHFFTENLTPITLLERVAAGYSTFQILNQNFQYDQINLHDLYIRNRVNGFNMVLPLFSQYSVVLFTPMQTIHFNFTGNVLNYNFPPSFSSRSFPYMLRLYDSTDTLIFQTISETTTDNFCDDPDCYMCERAFKNFSCLNSLHKFVLIFSVTLTIIFALIAMVIFLYLVFFFLKKMKCIYNKYFKKDYKLKDNNEDDMNNYIKRPNIFRRAYLKMPYKNKVIENIEDVNYMVNKFKATSFYDPSLSSNYNATSFIKYINSFKINFRGNSQFLLTFFFMSLFLSVAFAQCNVGGDASAVVSLCSSPDNNGITTCTLTLSVTATIDKIFNVYCGTVFDSLQNAIGTLRIGYVEAFYYVYYNLEYYTSDWEPVTQSNFRCFQAPGSNCNSDNCNAPNRTAFGNLDDPNLAITYGRTVCDRVANGALSCWLPQAGCLFSGYGVLPNSNTLTGVFRKTATSPMQIKLYYESVIYETRDSGFLTLEVGTPTEFSVYEIQVDASPYPDPDSELDLISFPSSKTKSIINPIGVYQSEKIGDIQSPMSNAITDPHYFNQIVTNPDNILISKHVQGHSANYVFHNSGMSHQENSNYKLPISIDHVHYDPIYTSNDITGFQYVQANMSSPPGITFTLLGAFPIQRTSTSCTFSLEILSFSGCCDCTTGAYFIYSVDYISAPFCTIYFSSNDISIDTIVNNQADRIYFHTSDCHKTVHLRASSGEFHVDNNIDLNLEPPVLDTFSEGVTTVDQITSEVYEEPGLGHGIKGFFKDKFDTHNILHWVMLIFILIVSICLLVLLCYCVFQIFMMCVYSRVKKTV